MDHVIYLLTQYKYFILFPLAIVEGPIIAVIAGLLCINGFLNPLFVFPVIVFGDIIGDTIMYSLGRWGVPGFLKKTGYWLGLTPEKLNRARNIYDSNLNTTISLSKITLGIGVAGIYMAGNAKVPYKKFIGICLVTSVLQYLVYLSVGILFGHAYLQINRYLNYFASISIVAALAVVLFFSIRKLLKKI